MAGSEGQVEGSRAAEPCRNHIACEGSGVILCRVTSMGRLTHTCLGLAAIFGTGTLGAELEAKKPGFSRDSGTFLEPFTLRLSTATPGARIVYTTDGTLPGKENGIRYRHPVSISATTQVRAATLLEGHEPAVATKSFVQLAPDLADYESGLPVVIVENFGAGVIPNKGWSTSTQTGGGLIQPGRQSAYLAVIGVDSRTEKASIRGTPDSDSRIGIRVRGAFSSTWNPKPYSFEAWKQGSDEDREIDPLGLPGHSDWILYYPHPNYDRTMLNNTFIWELSRDTGRYGTRFRFVDVFVNEDGGALRMGNRRGIYALAEKVTRGGKRIDFDRLSADGSSGGWLLGINRMDPEPASGYPTGNGATSPQFFHTAGPNRDQQTPPNTAGRGDDIPRQYNAFINFEDPNGYRILPAQRDTIENWFRRFENALYDDRRWRDPNRGYRRYLNTRDFIDYFHLLNLAKQGDGMLLSMFPWVSSDTRRLHMGPMWDFNNGAFGNSPRSVLYFRSDRLWYPRLFEDPDYRIEHLDRWYELREGALSEENMMAIIDSQMESLPAGLVMQQGLSLSSWRNRVEGMKSFLRTRAEWIDEQFFGPPEFSPEGGVVKSGQSFTLRSSRGDRAGAIYYTLDGTDPRLPDESVSNLAFRYEGEISLEQSVQVKARILYGGEWSALGERTFVTGRPADTSNLVISEIMYHPSAPHSEAEFVELLNPSRERIDLTGVSFTDGIRFAFRAGTELGPGDRILVVFNREAFETLYGTGKPVAGEFEEVTRLENAGERLTLTGADGGGIANVRYNDKFPWVEAADGGGFSLVLLDPGSFPDPEKPAQWRRSRSPGGSPGAGSRKVFSGIPDADRDGDGRSALLEYAYGTSDQDRSDRHHGLAVRRSEGGFLEVFFPRDSAAEDVLIEIEVSEDLLQWRTLDAVELRGPRSVTPEEIPKERWRVGRPGPGLQYVRVRASLVPPN